MDALDDEFPDDPPDSLLAMAAAMTSSAGEMPSIARGWSDAIRKREATLAAARQFLTETVEAVTPDMSDTELLASLTQYRAHLADLVAACSMRAPLARTIEETATALAVSPMDSVTG
jgi:hypothetical protein